MRIDTLISDGHAILTLNGHFDNLHAPNLQDELDSLLDDGIRHIVLVLREVQFINSTALGCIVKNYKLCKAQSGDLVIAEPSAFVRDIIGKLGVDELVPIYDEVDRAVGHVSSALEAPGFGGADRADQREVRITFPDSSRNRQIAGLRALVGTMQSVDAKRIQFLWSGKPLGLSHDRAARLFELGSEVTLKFQHEPFKKGDFELPGKVVEVEPSGEHSVRVTAEFEQGLPPGPAGALQT